MVYCPKFIPLRLLAFRYTPKALLCLKGAAAAEPQDVRETGDLSLQSRMFLSNRQWPLNNGFFLRLRRDYRLWLLLECNHLFGVRFGLRFADTEGCSSA